MHAPARHLEPGRAVAAPGVAPAAGHAGLLAGADLRGARVRDALFREVRFRGGARFSATRFSSHADFAGATAGAFRFAGASARTEVRAVRTWARGREPGGAAAARALGRGA
ncbi:pentapeptide repeat-containing protein [Amycolatopsis sp. cmx-8-4]|uniref:pentapeptide repeat-containing protein n=1 Tax=Amycolatopsis sp. cmx-8-4 TaxID=2790947 RepID=UPI00397D4385